MSGQIEVTPNGIKVPQASEIKESLQEIFTNALGTDLSLDDSTPQGNIIDGIAEQKQLDNAQILYFMNQLNPSFADGKWQDALASIYFIQRKQATNSVVSCICVGLPGTVLNGVSSGNPALAQSINGDIFQCLVGGTIPSSGSITLTFGSVETGPIPVGANTINKIYNVVAGWDSINNSTSGVLGEDVETRENFAARIKQSLALNATGSLAAVKSKVSAVSGVTDVKVEENNEDISKTKFGITLSPHSVYICQKGATDTSELAEAIFNSLSGGCDTNGSNTCSFTDSFTGVTYSYNYYTPTASKVYVKISVASALSSDAQDQIKEVLYKNFNGQNNDGYSKVTIGETVFASRFYSAVINSGVSDLVLNSISISKDGTNWYPSLSYNMNILPELDIESTSPSYVSFVVE